VITGASLTSIGASLALAIASQNPGLLILASRTKSKLSAVSEDILNAYPTTKLRQVIIDLSDLNSVKTAALEINEILEKEAAGKGLDVLFNNAGVNVFSRRLSKQNIELQFATNYLGPWLLTNLLLPSMLTSNTSPTPQRRIVNTSSEAHRISPIRFSDINQTPGQKVVKDEEPRRGLPEKILRGGGQYEPAIAYAQSKTAQVLHAVSLNARFAGRVTAVAVMPGSEFSSLSPFISSQREGESNRT
jgi:NAD(P)-dependent dehydrogenase (short-subunit alcohol dehydrogenase family)